MKANILILISLFTILFSCNSKDEKESMNDDMIAVADERNLITEIAMTPPAVKEEKFANGNQLEVLSNKLTTNQKKIIKDGSITVKSQDINTTKKGIDNLLKKWNAYYESEDLQNNDQIISYTLKIRIPATNFEKFILGIENGKDEIESKNIQTKRCYRRIC